MAFEGSDSAAPYSAMANEELIELSRESRTLVDSAQTALQKELDRRGLKPEPEPAKKSPEDPESSLYCPGCARGVNDPLTCGECSTMICRVCGTPLTMPEDTEPENLDIKDDVE